MQHFPPWCGLAVCLYDNRYIPFFLMLFCLISFLNHSTFSTSVVRLGQNKCVSFFEKTPASISLTQHTHPRSTDVLKVSQFIIIFIRQGSPFLSLNATSHSHSEVHVSSLLPQPRSSHADAYKVCTSVQQPCKTLPGLQTVQNFQIIFNGRSVLAKHAISL